MYGLTIFCLGFLKNEGICPQSPTDTLPSWWLDPNFEYASIGTHTYYSFHVCHSDTSTLLGVEDAVELAETDLIVI